jgi:hypothetical protein
MRLRVSAFVAVMFCAAHAASAQTAPPPPPPPVQAETNKSSIGFYGFARLDVIFDDSRINAFQTPTFVRSEADGAENIGNFTIIRG